MHIAVVDDQIMYDLIGIDAAHHNATCGIRYVHPANGDMVTGITYTDAACVPVDVFDDEISAFHDGVFRNERATYASDEDRLSRNAIPVERDGAADIVGVWSTMDLNDAP